MPGLRIGRLAPDAVVKDEEIKKDFVELRKTAERMVCDGCRFSACLLCSLPVQFLGMCVKLTALNLRTTL